MDFIYCIYVILKHIKNFAEPRQIDESMRYYNKNVE